MDAAGGFASNRDSTFFQRRNPSIRKPVQVAQSQNAALHTAQRSSELNRQNRRQVLIIVARRSRSNVRLPMGMPRLYYKGNRSISIGRKDSRCLLRVPGRQTR